MTDRPRLVGGIHRDVTGRADDPLRFYLTVDRRLKSGKLDEVELDEETLLRLVHDGAQAVVMYHRERKGRAR